jgi:hypothetical protein
MKSLIFVFSLFVSQVAFAEPITVSMPVPEGASKIIVKAFGAKVDTCNGHDLFATEAFGALEGYQIGIISTLMACPTDAVKLIDLETEVEIVVPKNETSFTFESNQITNLKIEFQ